MMTEESRKKRTCFVVMPISDPEGYDTGHFARAYRHFIKPACEKAGLECVRADDVKVTNHIVVDILQRILGSDLVVCDLSSRNPNVLYELGIRQAFDLPVVLIKDRKTERIFDIQGLRTLDYDETLRIDTVEKEISSLATMIQRTLEGDPKDVNSVIRLLSVTKAELTASTEISPGTSLILDAVKELSQRLTKLEGVSRYPFREQSSSSSSSSSSSRPTYFQLPSGEMVRSEEPIYDPEDGSFLGYFIARDPRGRVVLSNEGGVIAIPPDDERYHGLYGEG